MCLRLYVLTIISLFLGSAVYGVNRNVNRYDSEQAINQEFTHLYNQVQDKEFTVVTSTPQFQDGQFRVYVSTSGCIELFFNYKNSTNAYYIELKKKE